MAVVFVPWLIGHWLYRLFPSWNAEEAPPKWVAGLLVLILLVCAGSLGYLAVCSNIEWAKSLTPKEDTMNFSGDLGDLTIWGPTTNVAHSVLRAFPGHSLMVCHHTTAGSKSFCLKVRVKGEAGVIPYTQLPGYLLRSDSDWFHSLGEFRQVRRWVNLHRHRFKYDVQRLLRQWEAPV